MSWRKHGVVFWYPKAQLPTVSELGGRWRICYSSRDKLGRSFGSYIDVEPGKPGEVIKQSIDFIRHGGPGSCDVAGTMPMQWLGRKIYYIGWTLRKDVPYFNYTCVALETDGRLQKKGPILSPDTIDQGYAGTLFVLPYFNGYLGYYLSSIDWLPDENGALQPAYDIKVACSDDGLRWTKMGRTAIALNSNEAGLSSATVVEYGGVFHMWFSARGAMNFRSRSRDAYRIQHARSIDGFTWHRDEKYGLYAEDSFGENMCAYPSVIRWRERLFLFYNGRSFGEGGISYATMKIDELQ